MIWKVPFTKMVGTGNDFIVVDTRRERLASRAVRWGAFSRACCDRRSGIGADGVLVLEPSKTSTVKMRVINPDGSEAKMCGNGARCVALYLREATSPHTKLASEGKSKTFGVGASDKPAAARVRGGPGRQTTRNGHVTIETMAGVLSAQVRGHRVAIRMTNPTGLQLDQLLVIGRKRIRYGFVDTGVPHVVVRVAALDTVDVGGLGRALRYHARFSPKGTNVNVIQPDPSRANRLRIRTYERGVEAETLACGTGAVAAAILHEASQAGKARPHGPMKTRSVEIETRSGDVLTVSLAIRRLGSRLSITEVVLEGPATRVFDGCVSWPMRSI